MTQHDTEMATRTVLDQVRFDANGLVPAIAQQHDTGEVLMLAWLNRESLTETLATGRVCYYSRSRQALWRKGETSGQLQRVVALEVRFPLMKERFHVRSQGNHPLERPQRKVKFLQPYWLKHQPEPCPLYFYKAVFHVGS